MCGCFESVHQTGGLVVEDQMLGMEEESRVRGIITDDTGLIGFQLRYLLDLVAYQGVSVSDF